MQNQKQILKEKKYSFLNKATRTIQYSFFVWKCSEEIKSLFTNIDSYLNCRPRLMMNYDFLKKKVSCIIFASESPEKYIHEPTQDILFTRSIKMYLHMYRKITCLKATFILVEHIHKTLTFLLTPKMLINTFLINNITYCSVINNN